MSPYILEDWNISAMFESTHWCLRSIAKLLEKTLIARTFIYVELVHEVINPHCNKEGTTLHPCLKMQCVTYPSHCKEKPHDLPRGSMYGIYANIWGILMVNVTIHNIHGSYGL